MSSDDRTRLLARVNALSQENEWYKNEAGRLNARVRELYEWAEQVQRIDQEKTEIINNLNEQLSILSKKVSSADQRTLDQLYEENQSLRLKTREIEELISTASDFIIHFALEMPQTKERDSLAEFLVRTGIKRNRIVGSLLREPSQTVSVEALIQQGISSAELDRIVQDLKRKGLIQELRSGILGIVRQEERLAPVESWRDLPIPEAFEAAARVIYADPKGASDALIALRDAIADKVGGHISYALSREASAAKRLPRDPAEMKGKLDEILEQIR